MTDLETAPEPSTKSDAAADASKNSRANSRRRSRNPAARVCDEFRPRKKSTGARSTRSGRKSLDTPTPWPADQVERRTVSTLIPYARNARRHRPSQIKEIAASIKEWGWTVPILIDEQDVIIAGHGRVLAAEQLGIKDVPVVVARGWTDKQKRAYRLADNELASPSPRASSTRRRRGSHPRSARYGAMPSITRRKGSSKRLTCRC
jgi:hypothetical protein